MQKTTSNPFPKPGGSLLDIRPRISIPASCLHPRLAKLAVAVVCTNALTESKEIYGLAKAKVFPLAAINYFGSSGNRVGDVLDLLEI
jgi:hypothetical protein